jgi:hypothetical protein
MCFEVVEPRYCLSAIAFASHNIECCSVDAPQDVHAADLDGDGDMDVLFASDARWDDDKIAWYENTDGKGTFGQQQVITTKADEAHSVYAADLDGDGDMDVISAGDNIAWYINTDGKGAFGDQQDITTPQDTSVYTADLDGDGDMDVISTAPHIAWYVNTDGKGTFGDQQAITTHGAASVYATDLDGDGDMDVLSASGVGNEIAWYENTDGQGTFGPQQLITTQAKMARSVYAADLDGDGDIDVLSASRTDDKIAWYENTDGKGTFGHQQVITTQANGANSVYAVDLDGDGDIDVLSASEHDDQIAWYENTDGKGTFGDHQLITYHADGASSVYAADLDGDGDIDVLSASFQDGRIAWYENRLIGDANDDGVFNSSDLVQVFQAGEYEDGILRNSTYEEGDWNGDGEFDSSDLAMAFQTGLYEVQPQVNSTDLAAAVDWLFTQDQRGTRRDARFCPDERGALCD